MSRLSASDEGWPIAEGARTREAAFPGRRVRTYVKAPDWQHIKGKWNWMEREEREEGRRGRRWRRGGREERGGMGKGEERGR